MEIIKELWYGNVAPFEQCTQGDTKMKVQLSLMARNRDELCIRLTAEAHLRSTDQRKVYCAQERTRGISRWRHRLRDRP